MEETLKGIMELSHQGYVHWTLSMANVVVDSTGRIRLRNFPVNLGKMVTHVQGVAIANIQLLKP
jgi:RIO-like serine/threonine protein kinase